jgi:hypothetical protein
MAFAVVSTIIVGSIMPVVGWAFGAVLNALTVYPGTTTEAMYSEVYAICYVFVGLAGLMAASKISQLCAFRVLQEVNIMQHLPLPNLLLFVAESCADSSDAKF